MANLYQLDDVQFAYSKKTVLNIAHLKISSNTITALLGKNGAGKSTLMKLLAFLEKPQQGKIQFHSENITTVSTFELRKQVVLVAQKPYLLRGTVLDNIMLGLKFRSLPIAIAQEKAQKALSQVDISYLQNKQTADLSGGEAQKVALARALALQPKVLLLDEPFSHLDQDSIFLIKTLMKDFVYQKGHSIIYSTHNPLHTSQIAEKTINLDSGRWVKINTLL